MRSRALVIRFQFHRLATPHPGEDFDILRQRHSHGSGTAHVVSDRTFDDETPAGIGNLEPTMDRLPDNPPIALGNAHPPAAKDGEHFFAS